MKIKMFRKSSGFTLIELMTAMSITSILVVIIVGLTSVGVNFLKSAREEVVSSKSSRPVMLTLSTDLESMHLRPGNNFEWLYANREPYLDMANMKSGPNGMRASNAAQLMFFSSAPDRSAAMDADGKYLSRSSRMEGGDVNLISYRLVYRDPVLDEDASKDSLGFPVFALYRNVVSADSTFSGGMGGPALIGQKDLQNAYSSRERMETVPENFLAENIVEFTLAFEVEYQNGNASSSGNGAQDRMTKLIPLLATKKKVNVDDCNEFRIRGNNIYVNGSAGSTPGLSSGKVVAIYVSMTVITEEGMALIDQVRRGAKPLPVEKFFKDYSRNYTQRIPINRN